MQNKHKLKFGNINTTTCKTDEKLTQNILAVKNLGQEMCVFSETHRVTSGIEVLENWPVESGLNGWKYIGTGNEKRAQSGVGVVLSPEFKVIEIEVVLKSRILYVRLMYPGVKIQLWACYAPTNTKADTSKDDFFSEITEIGY